MVKNDGTRSNEEAFWDKFESIYGPKVYYDKPVFDEFYAVDFKQARCFCGYNPKAAEAVALARELGLRTALATNPLFPSVATETRIGWAGSTGRISSWLRHMKNSRFCKPNPEYYREMASGLGVECCNLPHGRQPTPVRICSPHSRQV